MSQLVLRCPTIIPAFDHFWVPAVRGGFKLYDPSGATYQHQARGIITPPVNFILKGNVAPHLAWHFGE